MTKYVREDRKKGKNLVIGKEENNVFKSGHYSVQFFF